MSSNFTGICACGSPPSVANGEVRYNGIYLNTSKAEYDCDSGYTNAGKDSLLCLADDVCSNPSWIIDVNDTNSGYPDCQAVVPDNDVYNTINTTTESAMDNWALFGLLLLLFLLLLLIVLLMCWYWMCRECCRRSCIKSCPCCRQCCYEIPYAQPRQEARQPLATRIADSPEPQRANYVREPEYQRAEAPVTPRKVIVVDRSPVVEDDNHIPPNSSPEISGLHPREFVRYNDDRLLLPKLEPRDFVSKEQNRVYKREKPIDTQGNPVWMPHAKNMRVGAHHMNTSTK